MSSVSPSKQRPPTPKQKRQAPNQQINHSDNTVSPPAAGTAANSSNAMPPLPISSSLPSTRPSSAVSQKSSGRKVIKEKGGSGVSRINSPREKKKFAAAASTLSKHPKSDKQKQPKSTGEAIISPSAMDLDAALLGNTLSALGVGLESREINEDDAVAAEEEGDENGHLRDSITSTLLNMTANSRQAFLSDLEEGRQICAHPDFDYSTTYRCKRTGEFLQFECSLSAIQAFHPRLFAGCRVKITRGPFAGNAAIVIGVREDSLWRHDDGDIGASAFHACKGKRAFDLQYGLEITGYCELPNITRAERLVGGGEGSKRRSLSQAAAAGADGAEAGPDDGSTKKASSLGIKKKRKKSVGSPSDKTDVAKRSGSNAGKQGAAARPSAAALLAKHRRRSNLPQAVLEELDLGSDGELTDEDEEDEEEKDPQAIAMERRITLMTSDPAIVFSRIPKTTQMMYSRVRQPFFYPAPVPLPSPKSLAHVTIGANGQVSVTGDDDEPKQKSLSATATPANTALAAASQHFSSAASTAASYATSNIPKPLGAFPIEIGMYDISPESLDEYGARAVPSLTAEEGNTKGQAGGAGPAAKRRINAAAAAAMNKAPPINDPPTTREQEMMRRAAMFQLRQGQKMLYTKGPFQGKTCTIIGLFGGRLVRQNDGEDGYPIAFDARDPIADAGLICLNIKTDVVESPPCPLFNEQIMCGQGILALAGGGGGGGAASGTPANGKGGGNPSDAGKEEGQSADAAKREGGGYGAGGRWKERMPADKLAVSTAGARSILFGGGANAENPTNSSALAALAGLPPGATAGMTTAEILILTKGKSTVEHMSVATEVKDSYYLPHESYLNRFCKIVNDKALEDKKNSGRRRAQSLASSQQQQHPTPVSTARFALPTDTRNTANPLEDTMRFNDGLNKSTLTANNASSNENEVGPNALPILYTPVMDDPTYWQPIRSMYADTINFCGQAYSCAPCMMAPLNIVSGLRVRFVDTSPTGGNGLSAAFAQKSANNNNVPFDEDLLSTTAIVLGFRSPAEGASFPVTEWARHFAGQRVAKYPLTRTEIYEKYFPNLLKPHSLLDKFSEEIQQMEELSRIEKSQKRQAAEAEAKATPPPQASGAPPTTVDANGKRTRVALDAFGFERIDENGNEIMEAVPDGDEELDEKDDGDKMFRLSPSERISEFFLVHTPILYVYSEAFGEVRAVPITAFTGDHDSTNEHPFRAVPIGLQSGPIIVPSVCGGSAATASSSVAGGGGGSTTVSDRHDLLIGCYSAQLLTRVRPPIPAVIKAVCITLLGRQHNEAMLNQLLLTEDGAAGGGGNDDESLPYGGGAEGFEDDSDDNYMEVSSDDESSPGGNNNPLVEGGKKSQSASLSDGDEGAASSSESETERRINAVSPLSSPRASTSVGAAQLMNSLVTPRSILKKKDEGGPLPQASDADNLLDNGRSFKKTNVGTAAKKTEDKKEAAGESNKKPPKFRRKKKPASKEGGSTVENKLAGRSTKVGGAAGTERYNFRSEARMVQSIGGGDTTSATSYGRKAGGGAMGAGGAAYAPLPRLNPHTAAGPLPDIGVFLCDLQAIANRFIQLGGVVRQPQHSSASAAAANSSSPTIGPHGVIIRPDPLAALDAGGPHNSSLHVIPKKLFSLDVRRYERTAQRFAIHERQALLALRRDDRKVLRCGVGGIVTREWLVRTVSDHCGESAVAGPVKSVASLLRLVDYSSELSASDGEAKRSSVGEEPPTAVAAADRLLTSSSATSPLQSPRGDGVGKAAAGSDGRGRSSELFADAHSQIGGATVSRDVDLAVLPPTALVPTPTAAALATATDMPLLFEVDLRAGAMLFHHLEQRDCIGRQMWATYAAAEEAMRRRATKQQQLSEGDIFGATASKQYHEYYEDDSSQDERQRRMVRLLSPFLSTGRRTIVTAFTDCIGNPLFPGAVVMITAGVRYGRRGVVIGCGRVKEMSASDRLTIRLKDAAAKNSSSGKRRANKSNVDMAQTVTNAIFENEMEDQSISFSPFFSPSPSVVDGCTYRCIVCYDYEGGALETLNHSIEPFILLENQHVQGNEMSELIAKIEQGQLDTQSLFTVDHAANGMVLPSSLARSGGGGVDATITGLMGSVGPGGFGDSLLGNGGSSGIFSGLGHSGGGRGAANVLGTLAAASAVGSNAALLSARSVGSNSNPNTARGEADSARGVGPSGFTSQQGGRGNDDAEEEGESNLKFWTSERDGRLLCFDTSAEATALFGLYSLQRVDIVIKPFTLHKQHIADRQAALLQLSNGGLSLLNASSRMHRGSLSFANNFNNNGDVEGREETPVMRPTFLGGGRRPVPQLSPSALQQQTSPSAPSSAFLGIGGLAAVDTTSLYQHYLDAIAATTNFPISTTSQSLVTGHPTFMRATVLGVFDKELWVLSDSTQKAVPLKGANFLELNANYRIAVIGLALEFPLAGIAGGGGAAETADGAPSSSTVPHDIAVASSIASRIDPLIGSDAMLFNANGIRGQSASSSIAMFHTVATSGDGGESKTQSASATAASAAHSMEAIADKLFLAARPRAFMSVSYDGIEAHMDPNAFPAELEFGDGGGNTSDAPPRAAFRGLVPPPPPTDTIHDGASYLKPFLVQWPIRVQRKKQSPQAFHHHQRTAPDVIVVNANSSAMMGSQEEVSTHDSTAWWAAQQRLSWDVLKRTATHIHHTVASSHTSFGAAVTANASVSGTTSSNNTPSLALAGKDTNHVLLTILLDTRDSAIYYASRGKFRLGDRITSSSKLDRPVLRKGVWHHYGPSITCTAVGACYGVVFGIFDASLEEERQSLSAVGMEERKVKLFTVAPIAPLSKFEVIGRGMLSNSSTSIGSSNVAGGTSLIDPTMMMNRSGMRASGATASASAFASLIAKAALLFMSTPNPNLTAFASHPSNLPALTESEVVAMVPAEFLRMPVFGCTAEWHVRHVNEAMHLRREMLRDVIQERIEDDSNMISKSHVSAEQQTKAEGGEDGGKGVIPRKSSSDSASAADAAAASSTNATQMSQTANASSSSSSVTAKLWRTLTESKFGPLASFEGKTAYEQEQLEVVERGHGGFLMMTKEKDKLKNQIAPSDGSAPVLVGSSKNSNAISTYSAPAPLHAALTSGNALAQMYPETYKPFGGGKAYSLSDETLVEACYAAWRAEGGPTEPRAYQAFLSQYADACPDKVLVRPSGIEFRYVKGLFSQFPMLFKASSASTTATTTTTRGSVVSSQSSPSSAANFIDSDPDAMLAELVSWILTSCGLRPLAYGHTAEEGMMKLLIAADVTELPSLLFPASGGGGFTSNAIVKNTSAIRTASTALDTIAPSRLPPLPRWADWQRHQTVALVHAEAQQRRTIFDACGREWSALMLDEKFRIRQILNKMFDGDTVMNSALSRKSTNASMRMMAVMAPTESAARNVEVVLRTMSFVSTSSFGEGGNGAHPPTSAGIGIEQFTAAANHKNTTESGGAHPHGKGGKKGASLALGPVGMRPQSSKLPWEFPYITAKGRHVVFDISYEACSPFGAFHGQRFRVTRGDNNGAIIVIIGVLMGKLWRYREDGACEAQPFQGTSSCDIFLAHGLEMLEPAEMLSPAQLQAIAGVGVSAVTAVSASLAAMRRKSSANATKHQMPLPKAATTTSKTSSANKNAPTSHVNHCLGTETELKVYAECQSGTAEGSSGVISASDVPSWAVTRTLRASFASACVRTADTFLYHTLQGEIVDFDVTPDGFASLMDGGASLTTPFTPATMTAASAKKSKNGVQSSSPTASSSSPPIRFGDRYAIGNPFALEKLCNVYEVGIGGAAKRRAVAQLISASSSSTNNTLASSSKNEQRGNSANTLTSASSSPKRNLVVRSPQAVALSIGAGHTPNMRPSPSALAALSPPPQLSLTSPSPTKSDGRRQRLHHALIPSSLTSVQGSLFAHHLTSDEPGAGWLAAGAVLHDDPTPPLFGMLTIIGVRDGRLWFAVDECGAQPYLEGTVERFFTDLQLSYMYTADVESTALDFQSHNATDRRVSVFASSRQGPITINTSPDAIAPFGPFTNGQIVYVSNGLAGVFGNNSGAATAAAAAGLTGFPTTIIGVRCGRLYHQAPDSTYCTPFDLPATQLMKSLKFTTRGERNTNHAVVNGEALRLVSPLAKFRSQHFAYPSPSGDVYCFDVSELTCRSMFGFSHGDRVKITRPENQAGKCVVILGVRSRQLWYIDEQLGVSAVFHGLRDHKSLMAAHGLVWVGRTAVKESIG